MRTTGMTKIADGLIRVLAAACLVISGVVHLELAKNYSHAPTKLIGEDVAFRLEAVTVIVLAVAVLLSPAFRRSIWALAGLVCAVSVAALLISRYSSSTSFPGIYPEPIWFFKKELTLVAEIIVVVLATAGIGLGSRGLTLNRRRTAQPA